MGFYMLSTPFSRQLVVFSSCVLVIIFWCNDGVWRGSGRSRHPLTTSLRRRLSDEHVRFLAFGGPSTWGFALNDPEGSTFSSILSDGYVHNVGQLVTSSAVASTETPSKVTRIPSGGGWTTLASLCTQSIVGDDNVYDVILLETSFHDFHFPSPTLDYDDDHEVEEEIQSYYGSLRLLATRIRQRFPLAKLIFVQLWHPSEMKYIEENYDDDGYDYDDQYRHMNKIGKPIKSVVTFDQWRAKQTDVPTSELWGSKEYSSKIKRHDWVVSTRKEEAFDSYLSHLANEVQGFIYKLPRPSSPTETLMKAPKLFVEVEKMDYTKDDGVKYQYVLSRFGHSVVANGIRSQFLMNLQTTILQSSEEWRNRVGDWGSGDSCQLWYETNQIDWRKVTYHGLSLRSFSKPMTVPKYALELSSASEDGGTITITNPFPESRMVYLTYMTTSDFAFSNKVYPTTKVQVSEENSVVLDPRHEDTSIQHQIPRTTAIGRIPGNHAQTTIRLETLEGTVSPFRVVGVSLLFEATTMEGATAQKIPTEFALITEPTHVGELHTYADLF